MRTASRGAQEQASQAQRDFGADRALGLLQQGHQRRVEFLNNRIG
jgi:hypothetical protein